MKNARFVEARPCTLEKATSVREINFLVRVAVALTGTPLSMLSGRLNAVKNGCARLSHAIRSRQTCSEDLFLVTSANIDELVGASLPEIATQLGNLVRWVANNLADDHLGAIALPRREDLAGVVGTVDRRRVDLLQYAKERGLVELTDDNEIALTHDGWKVVESKKPGDIEDGVVETDPRSPVGPERKLNGSIVTANCNKCGGDRNAYVRASHAMPGTDGAVSWETVIEILECMGCGELSARRKFWFSEWEDLVQDPNAGQLVRRMPEKTEYWPAKQAQTRPDWKDRLSDDNLRQVMDEVYAAVD